MAASAKTQSVSAKRKDAPNSASADLDEDEAEGDEAKTSSKIASKPGTMKAGTIAGNSPSFWLPSISLHASL